MVAHLSPPGPDLDPHVSALTSQGLQGISIIMPSVSYEWRGQPMVALASLSLYVGLILGAFFWGCSCDIVG